MKWQKITQQVRYARNNGWTNNLKTTQTSKLLLIPSLPARLFTLPQVCHMLFCPQSDSLNDWLTNKICLWLRGLQAWNAQDSKKPCCKMKLQCWHWLKSFQKVKCFNHFGNLHQTMLLRQLKVTEFFCMHYFLKTKCKSTKPIKHGARTRPLEPLLAFLLKARITVA